MILMTPHAYPNHLTDWADYQAGKGTSKLPPTFPRYALVNRFGARYRAAKSYRGAEFADYSDRDTARGYDALLKLVLAFSAFEYFYQEVLDLDVPGISKLLWDKHQTDMQEFQDAFDGMIKTQETDHLFRAMHPHLYKQHQKSIEAMLDGKTDLIKLFATLRHAFIHGHLTPNMDQVPPTTVIDLCEAGYTFLMEMMDKEFSRQLNPTW